MSDTTEPKDGGKEARKPLTLTRTQNAGTVRQSFPHGRGKSVAVEVKQTRVVTRPGQTPVAPPRPGGAPAPVAKAPVAPPPAPTPTPGAVGRLSTAELAARENALRAKREGDDERLEEKRRADEQRRALLEAQAAAAARDLPEEEPVEEVVAAAPEPEEVAAPAMTEEEAPVAPAAPAGPRVGDVVQLSAGVLALRRDAAAAAPAARAPAAGAAARPATARTGRETTPAPVLKVPKAPKGAPGDSRERKKLTLDMVERMAEGDDEKQRSLTSMRRAREREKQKRHAPGEKERVARDVTIPEAITVQDLAARMVTRAADNS